MTDKSDLSFDNTYIKYSPLKVLGRFENPFNEYRIQTVYEFFFNRIVEVFQHNRGGIPHTKRQMDELMPIHKPKWTGEILPPIPDSMEYEIKPFAKDLKTDNETTRNLHITWLGQSCSFVIMDQLKILTDPLFSSYLINPTLGPKRITEMPCAIQDVPTPDVIIVSHNHPDHLDEESLNYWGDNHPNKPLWMVPKGIGDYMLSHNISNFVELSWWETCQLKVNGKDIYQISATPAMHWSGRSVLDANRSLWCSFMIHKGNKPILFHAGDTGYVSDLYTRIGEKYGYGVKVALLPCGQYCPQWHQKPRHINPDEVLKIMKDLQAENVLGVHWGTFVLSGEYFREPKEKLELLAQFHDVGDNCYCPELGQVVSFD